MSALADLDERERYLYALLMDQSGIDIAELCWRDDTQPDWIFRCWDFQIPWYRTKAKFQIDQAGRALGKALDVDTPILTTNGWSTMGQLQVGDYVYDHEGCPTRVTAAYEVLNNRPCFAVKFDDGSRIVADAEHLWAVCYRKWDPEHARVITTSQMNLERLIAKRLHAASEVHMHVGHAMVTKISPVHSRPVRCIEVEHPNHLFRVGDTHIPTHNSVGIQMRAFAFPFSNPGEEMLITAPEMIHLDPVTKNIEDRLESTRLSREFLKKGGTSNGFSHRPFEAKFRNGARIVGRIPQKDGRGVKGCVGADTLVSTPSGPRRAGGIQPGDMVLTAAGRYRPVEAVLHSIEPCYVIGSATRKVIVSANHRFLAIDPLTDTVHWVVADDEDLDGQEWAIFDADGQPDFEPILLREAIGELEVVDLIVQDDFTYVGMGVVHKGLRAVIEQEA